MLFPDNRSAPDKKINLTVGMADMMVSSIQSATLVTYALGSCVGVAVYDPVAKVGGLLHAMLPDSSSNPTRAQTRPYVFVDTGLPALFHAVYGLGGVKSRLVVTLAGGAEMLGDNQAFSIGPKNVEMVKYLLDRNNVRLAASDTGGRDVRTVRLDLATGELVLYVTGKGSRIL